ncbi:hypothetical protein BaRGS_00027331 [Batillaria attramentaria]|uniref:Uncharacterized protein n=1 Tax=Batillaria attramentaria TaxID=370345 RepID=A0ABD0K3E2_9CAEN
MFTPFYVDDDLPPHSPTLALRLQAAVKVTERMIGKHRLPTKLQQSLPPPPPPLLRHSSDLFATLLQSCGLKTHASADSGSLVYCAQRQSSCNWPS